MSTILAIDPGPFESAYALIDKSGTPIKFGKVTNNIVLNLIRRWALDRSQRVVIEMVVSYGMAVGAEVFETCVWIGRFVQAFDERNIRVELIKRQPVKLHHCGSPKAKDANVIQALVDRYAPGEPNRGKGTKAKPGFFYGFKADVWQAFALAVYACDTEGVRDDPLRPL